MATTRIPPQAYTREVLSEAFNWLKTQPASIKNEALSADTLVRLYLEAYREPVKANPKANASPQNFNFDIPSANNRKKFKKSTPKKVSFSDDLFSLSTHESKPVPREDEEVQPSLEPKKQSSFEKLLAEAQNSEDFEITPILTPEKTSPQQDQDNISDDTIQKNQLSSSFFEKINKQISFSDPSIKDQTSKQTPFMPKPQIKPLPKSDAPQHEQTSFIDDKRFDVIEEATKPISSTTTITKPTTPQLARIEQETTPAVIENFVDSKSLNSIKEVQKYLNLSSEKEALQALISIGHRHLSQLFKP